MQKLYIIIYCIVGVILSSCTNNFRDMNTDKSGITTDQTTLDYNHLRIPLDAAQQGIYFNYDFGKGKNWPYQIMQNLNADMFCGYMHDYKPHNGGSHNSDYNLQDGWNGSNWLYTYSYPLPQLKKSEDATYADYPLIYGITKILKVETMHRISDIYGPIVYSSFGQANNDFLADTQQEAYELFFEDLDIAIRSLSSENENSDVEKGIIPKFDIILDGEVQSWIKFANSLRMRLAIRIAMADPEKAREEFLKSFNHPSGYFQDPKELASVLTKNGYQNPLGEINRVWREVQMNAVMESILNGYEDPRRELFFEPCTQNIVLEEGTVIELAGNYKGIRQGTCFSHTLFADFSKIYVNQNTAPILMTAAEIWFLRAEAALRGWTTEDVYTCYKQGIYTSFRQWGATASIDDYLQNDNIGTDYIDPFDPANNIPARCRVSPRWDETTTNEEKLEKIITQKWLAIFPEGCEAWAEQRRTGYPRLFPVRFNNSKNGNIDAEIMIRRLNFPSDMIDYEPQQYEALVKALNGLDNAGTRLWWDTGRNF